MNPRNTWLWLLAAAGLFGVIFCLDRFLPKPPTGPQKVIPDLNPSAVVSLQIQPAGQRTIRAERTNGGWQLTEPLLYPAPSTNIESLLNALEQLTSAAYITPAELKHHPQANQEYGFDPPQASLVLDQRDSQSRIWVGHSTMPGDQVYVQVVGTEGIHVVDASLLKWIPRTDKDWRDTALVDWPHLEFDHLSATNGGKILELQRNPTNQLWRIIHHPLDARADNDRVERSLANLHQLRAREFVSDEPKPDLEAFGLLTPDLTLTFFQGTNSVLMLQFGKNEGTNANRIYAKRADRNTIVVVDRNLLESWRASQDFRDFFDHHLLSLTVPLDSIKVIAQDEFTLQRQTNETWRIVHQDLDLPADVRVMGDVIAELTNMPVKIVRDVVTDQDWPTYGLATPARQYILTAVRTDPGDGSTNPPLAQIFFGIVDGTNVFARQSGETFVYQVDPEDLDRLPSASYQMRERRIWNFSEDQVARLIIQTNNKTRELIRNGTNSWTLGTNSQGIINPLGVNDAVVQLGQLTAARWVERGDTNRVQYGITTNALQITVELKDGRQLSVAIGEPQPPGIPNAVATLEGEPWIFAFPWPLYPYVTKYLSIPPYVQ
jgi:hypothetical protein